MSGGGKSNTTTVQKSDPWAGIQPYLLDIFGQASELNQQGPRSYYPDSTVAQPSSMTNWGIGNLAGFDQSGYNQNVLSSNTRALNTAGAAQDPNQNILARASNALTPQALQTVNTITSGGGVQSSNPYLDAVVNNALSSVTRNFNEGVLPNLTMDEVSSGNYGGSTGGIARHLLGNDLIRNMGDLSKSMYMGAYESAQDRALQGAGMGLSLIPQAQGSMLDASRIAGSMSPIMQAAGTYGADQQLRAGALDESYRQKVLDDLVARWNFGQAAPWQNLSDYSSIIGAGGGAGGGSSTTSGSAPGGSPLLGALGGAATGAGLVGALGGTFGAGAAAASPWAWPVLIGASLLGGFGGG